MIKTGIIGHRGAAGLALENSSDSLIAALKHGVDAIEFDVRRTKDNRLVVMHDKHTGRIAEEQAPIHQKTLAELQKIKLKNGQRISSLEEVFALLHNKIPMVIDIKDTGSAPEILRLMKQYPKAHISLTSLLYGELSKIQKVYPEIPIFVRDRWNPFEIIHTARRMHAVGISLNMWLMNPLTYFMAMRRRLEVRVYTVNNELLGFALHLFYPGIVFYTDHPERFVAKKKT